MLISPTQLIATFSLMVLDACTDVTIKVFLSNEFDVEPEYSCKLRYQADCGAQALANSDAIQKAHASVNAYDDLGNHSREGTNREERQSNSLIGPTFIGLSK